MIEIAGREPTWFVQSVDLCALVKVCCLEGPNAAFFSRGGGTVRALREAAFAVADGDAPVALAGGADSALYPVTAFELARGGADARPSEGAALLALSARPTPIHLLRAYVADSFALAPRSGERGPALAVVTASDPDARRAIAAASRADATEVVVIDDVLGETLAAAPALAWAVAFDWLTARPGGHARIVSRGPDGEVGIVELAGEAA